MTTNILFFGQLTLAKLADILLHEVNEVIFESNGFLCRGGLPGYLWMNVPEALFL